MKGIPPASGMAYMIYWTVHTVAKAMGASAAALNVEDLFILGWLIQAFLSMVFMMKWQRSGSIRVIVEQFLTPIYEEVSEKSKRLRQIHKDLMVVIVVNFIAVATIVIAEWVVYLRTRSADAIFEASPVLLRDIFHSFFLLYAQSVWHISLCIFIVVMKCMTLELGDFNGRFEHMLESHERKSSGIRRSEKKRISDRLLDAFVEHNKLADKVTKIDEIFRSYAFVMLMVGGAHTIFALISMIRQRSWIHLFFFIYDVCICMCHLFGVCISAAQVYVEYRIVKEHLQRHTQLWVDYDQKVYDIARMFIENAHSSSVGITIYGFTLITKSLILSCLARIIPYVLICLQLQMGTTYESWRNSNMTTD
ncbi:GUstatory Receptor family [Ditylenchus destructor]|uniref:GUstatory Receptor family n=1 Tax=Ditylenchus destructor TaxID=166010 RepID=A0AAD4ML81_9BILA|nr:GUstatory Receptor family [Ditylenchus destructor]